MKEKVIPCLQGMQVAHDTSVILQKETFSLQKGPSVNPVIEQ